MVVGGGEKHRSSLQRITLLCKPHRQRRLPAQPFGQIAHELVIDVLDNDERRVDRGGEVRKNVSQRFRSARRCAEDYQIGQRTVCP